MSHQMIQRHPDSITDLGGRIKSSLPPYVSVGSHTYFADLYINRWGDEQVNIGKYCSISQNVRLLAGGNHRTNTVSTYPFDTMFDLLSSPGEVDRSYERQGGEVNGIEIGNDVWVGYAATIQGKVKVGNGAVIGGGAHVFGDVPPYAIVVGNPAKVTKYRFNEEVIQSLLEVKWWEWPDEVVRERVDWFYLPVRDFIMAAKAEVLV